MQSTTLLSSPVKDGRRVLGEKPANACLSPARRHAASPTKRSLLGPLSSPQKLLPSPSFVGQKRTIDQVNDQDSLHGESRAETPSLHDVREETPTQLTADNDDRPDQEQTDARDESLFDKQQTPQPQESQIPTTQLPAAGLTRNVPEDPETRKQFIQEKAALLRDRIQSAMRHVRDPQFDRRLSELEAHSRKFPRLSLPEATAPSPQDAVTPRQQQDSPSSAATTPRALQPPIELKPSSESTSTPHGLSSPPLSTGNSGLQDPMRTPTQRSRRRADSTDSPVQLSSPPATVSRTGRDRLVGTSDETEEDCEGTPTEKQAVTPSQRGDAVDGLLKLMNTGDKRESSNTWTG
ncbi:hypothetical protein BDV25DRAFT_127812 [Aspergillus avenaceus]|uniref:Uncharacterized protein n=1 Tax=Aspergillus avenaceus TaxID=36643 RepID=A0A5N6U2F5_ASPAV|nr:hypothetical protein BDV25DRAFT_127812 [Aspergillus avenaceus]